MHSNRITHWAKAIICFCLFFPVDYYLSAQNTGYSKYIITPMDTCSSINLDILEINNHYYLSSVGYPPSISPYSVPIITVFDNDLNAVKQILLVHNFPGGSCVHGKRNSSN